ncbi:MAG: T9SS type A sorting domain-containing protein, partial [Candidatus Eisenbacteria sp.]|nr:T9SS type A sorting domain-containing protein [Candidatus Eisenbacteria bacterium]
EYFEKEPTGPGTGVNDGGVFVSKLDYPRPNPFNPRTTVEYTVATPGHVTLRVYDLAGRAVRTLVDGDVEVGEHRVVWDGTTDAGQRAASGVYFVRLESFDGSKTEEATQKLVLLY